MRIQLQKNKTVRGMLLTCLLIVFVTIFSCKKRNAFNSEEGQTLADVTLIRAYSDMVLDEAHNAVSNQFFLRGKPSGGEGIQAESGFSNCAYVVDTTLIYTGILRFNYTGSVCNNYKREGQVIATLQNYPTKKWKDRGSILKLEFANYIITNVAENKSLKFNGIEYITNESGGTWYELKYLNLPSVVSRVSGNDIKVTFDKTLNVFCNVERKITYTIKGTVISGSTEGTASQNNLGLVEYWGTDRNDKDFTSRIESNVIWNSTCTATKPTAGQVVMTVNGKYYDLNANYGTDQNGDAMNTTDCAYGWKMTWTLRNKTKKRVFNY